MAVFSSVSEEISKHFEGKINCWEEKDVVFPGQNVRGVEERDVWCLD